MEHQIPTEKIYHFSGEQENKKILVDIFRYFQMLGQIVGKRGMGLSHFCSKKDSKPRK